MEDQLEGELSFATRAAKSGFWFALFKFISQGFSWAVTVVVARLLLPEDYGLMAMATIIIDYVAVISELGIGASIVQRKNISRAELSGLFWFGLAAGCAFGLIGFGLSFVTALIFDEPRVVPVTQVASVRFVIGALMMVPFNLLVRDARFKQIGILQLVAVIITSLSMLLMAHQGFGVWTLLLGGIVQQTIQMLGSFAITNWRPDLSYSFQRIRSSLNFGFKIAGAGSVAYFGRKLDIFIVGDFFGSTLLGYYRFALQLASIPTERFIEIIRQVSFPVFSRYQDDLSMCQETYLRIEKYICLIAAPFFFGGAFFSEDIINTILGDKWKPIIPVFRVFCIGQFFVSMAVVNRVVHNALGRPGWTLIYNLIHALLMFAAFWVAASVGFEYVVMPWISMFPLISLGWTYVTLRKLEIPVRRYLRVFAVPAMGVVAMCGLASLARTVALDGFLIETNYVRLFALETIVAFVVYSSVVLAFERRVFQEIRDLRKA